MNTDTAFDMLAVGQYEQDNAERLGTMLWAKKNRVILCALLFAALGLAYALTMAPQFQAEALIQLETRNAGLQFSADIAEMLSPESEANTEIEILKSRLVLNKVVDALSLDVIATPQQLPVVGNYLSRVKLPRLDWQRLKGYAWHGESIAVKQLVVPVDWLNEDLVITKKTGDQYEVSTPDGDRFIGSIGVALENNSRSFTLLIDALQGTAGTRYITKRISTLTAANTLRRGLTIVEKGRGTGILRVAIVSPDKAMGESIVAEIVDAYIDQNIGRSVEEADKSLAFLEKQLPIIQSQLRVYETELNEYRLKSESIDLNYEAQSILERSVSLDAQISGLSLEETELSRRYTTNHPIYRALLEKKDRLLDEKQLLSSSVKTLPATQQEILRKTRDVEVSQQIYVQLLNKSQELSVMKAGAVGNVRLIEAAVATTAPVAPNIPLMVAIAGFLGAAIATVFIFIRNNMSYEINSPEDIAHISIPVLTIIPFSRFQFKNSRRHQYALLSLEHNNEIAVEAIRSLRTSLHFSLQERESNIICVAGPSPTIGKSFVSSNLAFLAAQSGSKVLVVDGDMRRGNLGRYFGVPQDLAGLAELLDGSRAPSTVMYEVDLQTLNIINPENSKRTPNISPKRRPHLVADLDTEDVRSESETQSTAQPPHTRQESDRPFITVVPRGQAPRNPSELLMHNRFPEFLEQASQGFDLVIVDTPPLLAATDGVIVGKYSDINLLVVRQGETTTHEVEEVMRAFSNNNSPFTGIVFNGYDVQGGKYGKYGAQYGYRYAYWAG